MDCPLRALDIGCAVGGSTFELAKYVDFVDGMDISTIFIDAANKMKEYNTPFPFRIPMEGRVRIQVDAMHEPDITESIRAKTRFFVGDACLLNQPSYRTRMLQNHEYDGILLANILCRIQDPISLLDALPHIVQTHGIVLIVTSYSWLHDFTPRNKWMGGFYDPLTKNPIFTRGMLQIYMEARGFEFIYEEQVPFVLRENQRTYHYIISEATGRRKK